MKGHAMRGSILLALLWVAGLAGSTPASAQDVPGIEICTAEKTMERRTSCLQSNVNFLQQSVGKLRLDQQQRLDAANRQIDALKATVTSLQKTVEDLQAAQKAAAATPAKPVPAPAKDAAPAAKDGAK
jgi:formate dehydrogenase assembly factor FdhD